MMTSLSPAFAANGYGYGSPYGNVRLGGSQQYNQQVIYGNNQNATLGGNDNWNTLYNLGGDLNNVTSQGFGNYNNANLFGNVNGALNARGNGNWNISEILGTVAQVLMGGTGNYNANNSLGANSIQTSGNGNWNLNDIFGTVSRLLFGGNGNYNATRAMDARQANLGGRNNYNSLDVTGNAQRIAIDGQGNQNRAVVGGDLGALSIGGRNNTAYASADTLGQVNVGGSGNQFNVSGFGNGRRQPTQVNIGGNNNNGQVYTGAANDAFLVNGSNNVVTLDGGQGRDLYDLSNLAGGNFVNISDSDGRGQVRLGGFANEWRRSRGTDGSLIYSNGQDRVQIAPGLNVQFVG
jgi:hypothetical protein